MITIVPLRLDKYPYYEAHGLAIATFFNREFSWSEGVIQGVLIVVCLAVAARRRSRSRLLRRGSTAFAAVAGVAAAAVVAWGLTGQVYAAEGERDLSEQVEEPAAAARLGRARRPAADPSS